MAAGYKWKRLQRAVALPASEALIRAVIRHYGCKSREEAINLLEFEARETELWRNDLYQVEVRRHQSAQHVHLNIRRIDGWPGRDWRHFQQIKNELVGPECEGVELYPAESRLTDTTNKYHLYVSTDPEFRFPFGYQTRDVQYGADNEGGLRQQPPMQYHRSAR